jgi:hypothetical protein
MMSAYQLYRFVFPAVAAGLLLLMTGLAEASTKDSVIPADTMPSLHYLLDLAANQEATALDAERLKPFMSFVLSSKSTNTIYRADGSFGAPSAYHEFSVNRDLQHLVDYTMDSEIPSFFFWPSSLRLTRWTRVDGGKMQFDQLKAASAEPGAAFILRGAEYITITPDQHTGAYYSYDVDKLVILTPFQRGKVLLSISRQQEPSAVGRKGWVVGKDDDWSYLYTQDTGLNVGGLGWVSTYMYDSFNITVYFQPDPDTPVVTCGVFSWVKAGWAGINMVQPKHIHRGLVRVATAFKDILEDPRLPEPAILAQTFSSSKFLPTATLKAYVRDYFAGLEKHLADFESLRQKVGKAFDSEATLAQMTRDELYSVVALDYFKKILGRNPVMESHPF